MPLPFLAADVEALPEGVDAVVITSDLQGREFLGTMDKPGRLLAEVVAERLCDRRSLSGLPDPSRIGVVLAGDLYAREAGRGGVGNILPTLATFAERFAWVVAVGGNHDDVGSWPISQSSKARLRQIPRLHFLDGEVVELGGVRFGGLSGVEGDPRRPFRRDPEEHAMGLELVLLERPDVLVLHQGPSIEGVSRKSSESVAGLLQRASHPPALCVCGHDHWARPLVDLPSGTRVLNVDHRVVILQRAAETG